MLDELEAKTLLGAYAIPVVKTLAVRPSAVEAAEAAREIGYPVTLKILSPDISHKSDVGGVCLDLRDESELRRAADAMLARVAQARPSARISGFTVQSMAKRPLAQELIVGASIDPLFGPVVLFGQGGTAVEVVADRAIALPPLNRVLSRELVSRTRVCKLLAGYRDHPAANFNVICDVLVALSQMLADLPEVCEVDINPLLADGDGVIALDARVRVSRKAPAGSGNFAIAPYPAEWVETIAWHGETLVLRPIRPEDEPQHRAFFEKLDPQDIRLRFFSLKRALPHSELARLAQIDYAREMAFIAVRGLPDGSSETLGVVRGIADPDNVEAEFAIIVRSDLKGRGLGGVLMRKLIAYLSRRGTQRVTGLVLRENEAMRRFVLDHGFTVDATRSDSDAQCYVLELPGPR